MIRCERPKGLPKEKEVDLMLQCGEIDGVQIHKCLESSRIKIFKDGELYYEILNQYCRNEHIMDYRIWCQELSARKGVTVFDDSFGAIRKTFFKRGPNCFVYKSHGITAKYNYCEVYNVKHENFRKTVTLEGRAKGILFTLTRKKK